MTLSLARFGSERSSVLLHWLAELTLLPPEDGTRVVVDPHFQRGAVWTPEQKEAWIESILRDLPLPAMFINRFPKAHPIYGHNDVVIDGQQRLRATAEFIRDKFTVRGETWSQQDDLFKRHFRMNVVVPVIYTKFDTERECASLYVTLLTAGTGHTKAEITRAKRYAERSSL